MLTREHLLKNAIKIGIFILPFLPYLVTSSLFFPFITGKNFTFRIVIEVLIVLWSLLVLHNRVYHPRMSVVLWSVLGFFGVLVLSTIFSINSYKSFWSNAERMEGLFGMLHVLAFFLIATGVFRKKEWVQFFLVVLVASVGVAFHGIGQLLGLYDIHQGGVRVDANFGNAAYFAGYSLFIIFVSLLFVARVKRGGDVPFARFRTPMQWALGVLASVFLLLLYFNATRGAMLGLLAGLFVTSLLFAVFGRRALRKWGAVLASVLVL